MKKASHTAPYTAEIISIGNELLTGQTRDAHQQFISKRLSEISVPVHFFTTVSDHKPHICNALITARHRSRLVFVTGGLGPTWDDITLDAFSCVSGVPLALCNKSLARINGFLRQHKRQLTPQIKKQALLPKGSLAIQNKVGTAPGVLVDWEGVQFIFLPGPPRELNPMLNEDVLPFLKDALNLKPVKRISFYFPSQHETDIARELNLDKLGTLIMSAGIYAKPEGVRIVFTLSNSRNKLAQQEKLLTAKMKRLFPRRLMLINCDDLAKQALHELGRNTLSVAESCTGGLLGQLITSVQGSSLNFKGGYITYSNSLKQKLLDVPSSTLKKYGAVSSQAVRAMAMGCRKHADSDWAVAITGIAGPGGGTSTKPVGLVYIGIQGPKGGKTWKCRFSGSRILVRQKAAAKALSLLIESVRKSAEKNSRKPAAQ